MVDLTKRCRAYLHRINEPPRQCVKPLAHDWTNLEDQHRSEDGLLWSPGQPSTKEDAHV